MNFILTIIITFILALIFMVILAFVVKITGELVFGDAVKGELQSLFAPSAIIASSILAGASIIGGKSDVTIIN